MKRRKFIISGAAGSLAAAGSALGAEKAVSPKHPTPGEIEGPFYPVIAQKDKDFDLTRIEGKEGVAKGRHIIISGAVYDTEGNPVEEATVDLWQANAAGRYRHPHDPNTAPLDENFQGWAIVPSGKTGEFRFKTVFPGAYPASDGWTRPPHIHFKVSKRGYVELITQMYFPGQELNGKDLLLQRKSAEERKLMIAEKVADNPESYQFKIVIQRA
ncbi:MAG TPA: protocatechuate 3,4-dioxygenase [Opitutales bacterium]|nr:protocatechuate 3,4-dioxygenase [Opitutales bacterium]